MASLITHPVVPLVMMIGLGQKIISLKLFFIGAVLSILPDLDVLLLYMGVPWTSVYGHRGFTHSLIFALVCGVLIAYCFKERKLTVLIFCFLIVTSHIILDAMTWGGQGVAVYWPFSDTRIRFSERPIPASPLNLRNFIRWGGFILKDEWRVVWRPLLIGAVAMAAGRYTLTFIMRRLRPVKA